MDTTKIHETTIDRIEAELDRLRAARPALVSRIERAEHIIVTQLSTANGTHRPIKVRVHADGSRSFAVRSGSKLRRCYTVEAGSFRCDCPDARRRHAACKHGIAAYLLERALRRPFVSDGETCFGCGESGRELVEVCDSLTYFDGDLICRDCLDASDATPI